MDTWATSSMTPQIAGRWLDDPALYAKVFPYHAAAPGARDHPHVGVLTRW